MAFSGMTLGLNGQTPVAAKVAFMVSGVNAHKNARPNTPAKSLFTTLLKCKSSNAWISRQNSNYRVRQPVMPKLGPLVFQICV